MNQRVNSSTFYAPRSSSIQSIRSNKSNMKSRKAKKSDCKHSKNIRVLPKRKVSFSSESESSSGSRTDSPSSALAVTHFHPKMADSDSKPAKGLSKFANKKGMTKSRKGGMSRLAKMKGFKTKKEKIEKKSKLQVVSIKDDVSSNNESNKNILAPLQEVSETDSPYVGKEEEKFINFPDKEEVKLNLINMREVSIPIPLDRVKSGPENKIASQDFEKFLPNKFAPKLSDPEAALKKPESVLPKIEEKEVSPAKTPVAEPKAAPKKSPETNIFTPKVSFVSHLADPKTRVERKRKTIYKIDTFNSIFDSFGSEQIQAKPSKRRRRSIIMSSAKNSSSLALPALEKDTKYSKRHSMNPRKMAEIEKNRSKSLVLPKRTGNARNPRRVISDFHELLSVRRKVAIDLFTGKQQEEQKPQEKSEEKSEENSQEISNNEDSVSEDDASSSKFLSSKLFS